MSYFTLFQRIQYNVNDFDQITAIDLTQSIRFKEFIKSYRYISYTPYIVHDGERPDQVAYKVYGNQYYDWIILLTNDVYSIYDDWPKSSEAFDKYIADKYGSVGAAQTSYRYYNIFDHQIDLASYTNLSANERKIESVYEYEQRKNIIKSRIKLLNPAVIPALDTALKSSLENPIV